MTYEKVVSIMSGNFLTEEISSNWQGMEQDDLDKFILDHVSSPYENWDIEDVWALIEQVGSAAFGLHDLGGEFQVKNSKSYKAIKDAIESVDDSEIYIRQPNNDHVGWAYVVLYGNDPEETVSDYGDNGFMDTWNNTYNALLKEQENA